MSEAVVHRKRAPLKNRLAFIDGTARPICRPSKDQRLYFFGHKRLHVLKYQFLMCPNGLICQLDGPYLGRRHDAAFFGTASCMKSWKHWHWTRNSLYTATQPILSAHCL